MIYPTNIISKKKMSLITGRGVGYKMGGGGGSSEVLLLQKGGGQKRF